MDRIRTVKKHLLLHYPFFASYLFSLEIIEDNSIETACTNGEYIKFNRQFVKELSFDQLITLVAHEVAHVAFFHHLRMRGKDIEQWNSACDYAINLILVGMGLSPVKNWLYDIRYNGMSAEDIYKLLQSKPKAEQKQIANQSKNSGGKFEEPTNSNGSSMDDKELSKAQDDAKSKMVQSADNVARTIKGLENSSVPNDEKSDKLNKLKNSLETLGDIIDWELQSKIDWREALHRFLFETALNDYSFLKPDSRFTSSSEFLLPSLYSEEIGSLFIGLDVSGSCASEAKQIVTECKNVFMEMEGSQNATLKACYCSDHIHCIDEINSESDIKLIYGGGTDFKEAMQAFENDDESKAMVFVTDGEVYSIGNDPCKPVLWVLTRKNNRFRPAFGEIVHFHN